MKLQDARSLCGLLVLGALGCGAENPDEVGTATSALRKARVGSMAHVLRVNAGQTTVRNICELTVSLPDYKPLAFQATGETSGGKVASSLGWKGYAVSIPGLSITGCDAYPCDVTARWQGAANNGVGVSCQMVGDDATSQLIGNSTGSSLQVNGAPTFPVIFNQSVRLGPPGEKSSAMCVLRQDADLPGAVVSNLRVLVDGVEELNLLGPIPVGAATWSQKLDPDPVLFPYDYGTIYVGSDGSVTRLKHVTPRKTQFDEGNTIRCRGEFESPEGTNVFSVNTNAVNGTGVSLVTSLISGWTTCNDSDFGTNNGCQTGCGIADPDCLCGDNVCANGESGACELDCGCAHGLCQGGSLLAAGCSACVDTVCAADPFCCDTAWDGICVGAVASLCGLECPATSCSNGVCDADEEEGCPADCHCGNGACEPAWTEDLVTCPADCTCGNGTCEPAAGEDLATCPVDCTCGNGACEPASGEDVVTCPADCTCGNGACEPGESIAACLADCHCGNGTCEGGLGEDSSTCSLDCNACGHSLCVTGNPVVDDCDLPGVCATAVCAADPFCCSTSWDNICISELSVCGQTCPPP